MKFDSAALAGLFTNEGDVIGKSLRAINPDQKVVISQGYGMSQDGLPLRALAYAVPVLRLLKLLPERVTAELYFARCGVLRANNTDAAAVNCNFVLLEQLIRNYVAAVHPELVSRVCVLDDAHPDEQVSAIIDRLVDQSQALAAADESIRHFLDKRGGARALRYMVEHSIYMRDPLDFGCDPYAVKLVPDMQMDMDYVVMVGGPAEKIFHRFRTKLAAQSKVHQTWQSLQFFTPVGDIPTYHLKQGEPTWQDRCQLAANPLSALQQMVSDVPDEYGAHKHIVRDMMVLLLDAGGSANFSINGLPKQVLTGKSIPQDTVRAFDIGWNILRSLP